MLKSILTASAIMMGLVLPSAAQDDEMITGITQADLKALVIDMGDVITDEEDDMIFAEDVLGTVYSLRGTACSDTDCKGVEMTVKFDRTANDTPDDINRASLEFAAVKVWYDDDEIGVSRYVILDYGMTMKNLEFNLDVLLGIAPSVIEVIDEQ